MNAYAISPQYENTAQFCLSAVINGIKALKGIAIAPAANNASA